MRPWIRSYQLFLDFCPRRAFLAAPGSPWQPLAATKLIFCMIFAPGGRKIVITISFFIIVFILHFLLFYFSYCDLTAQHVRQLFFAP